MPNEDLACLAYCVEEDEDAPECVSIASEDSDFAVQKPEGQSILQGLASLKRKEADCYDRLAATIPEMTDEEVTEVGERVQPSKLPKCVDQLYDRLKNPRNFRTMLAVGSGCSLCISTNRQASLSPRCPNYVSGTISERPSFTRYSVEENIRKKCPHPSQKVPNQLGGLQWLKLQKKKKHLKEKGAARNLRKTLCEVLHKTNPGPYRTTNSSKRKYKLKS